MAEALPVVEVAYGRSACGLRLPAGTEVIQPVPGDARAVPASRDPGAHDVPDPLGVVADALDRPVGLPPLEVLARGRSHVTVVVPDPTRPAAAATYLLPILARLARAGHGPSSIRVLVARGIHAAAARDEVEAVVGPEVMAALRPLQSAPDLPEWNEPIAEDPQLGTVRVHRLVADAGLVLLTGAVTPHHLAGFGGGAKALVPGTADRDTVLAAHRLTLRTLVRPDGSLAHVAGRLEANPFREALLRVARAFGRCALLNVVLDRRQRIVGAAYGEVGEAHAQACARWRAVHAPVEPQPCDLVVAGVASPRADDLVQAHKALIAASAWARPGAPIAWLVQASHGAGHPEFLPWFESGRLERHLAALRRSFHPYGLTAYSVRRIAAGHPVVTASEVSADILRGMGLLPCASPQAALDHALGLARPQGKALRVAVLADAGA
ncbi:MAG: lactate racemase domain-containing protein [Planctomycetia bacterium]